ncbi:GMP synthase [Azorhizobium oxalatiphilum]|uniref:GMP synthase n=1 Tax=Azorhizobium oxalatiphilum TaxID=980631 RepID=A0A917FBS5_9HYPH|nr:glutamine amidotransferase [Azorhizobium oxalatiphilum]GGF68302.1 GMP synthase [Azorhizobium oxalatiphilum]
MSKTALVLRHIHFEDLGSLSQPIGDAGYAIRYSDVGQPDFLAGDPAEHDLLIVLGGPIGVYEEESYPFLAREKAFIAQRLARGLPTLGICLGAQLIAASLGASVCPSGLKEIGFSPLILTDAGENSPLRHLRDIPVLHWHGDTYDLPAEAELLAATAIIRQQAFRIGASILGLQFHPEADCGPAFERWLVGHAHELAAAQVDIRLLREDAGRLGERLGKAAHLMMRDWLANLAPAT